ncbi:MAG: hypothetical protein AB7O46_00180 [Xanthobacteraceae bacterium]
MSKLARSDAVSMNRIDAQSAIEGGNEDCIGLHRITAKRRCVRFQCEQTAVFKMNEGGAEYCERHAIDAVTERLSDAALRCEKCGVQYACDSGLCECPPPF